jgi:hypothetical protein
MRNYFWLIGLTALGCAHVVKDVSDCNSVTGEKRVECGACMVQNKADGWLGIYEYHPDDATGHRCIRVK